jgi:hypothetical protein
MEETTIVKLGDQLAVLIEEIKKLNQNILKINADKPQERPFKPRSFGGAPGGERGNGKFFGAARDKKHFGGFNRQDRTEKRFIADGRKKDFKPKRHF